MHQVHTISVKKKEEFFVQKNLYEDLKEACISGAKLSNLYMYPDL